MNVLLLSPYPERIASIVSATGDAPRTTMDRLELGALRQSMPDFIVSYGYRRLIGRGDPRGNAGAAYKSAHLRAALESRG